MRSLNNPYRTSEIRLRTTISVDAPETTAAIRRKTLSPLQCLLVFRLNYCHPVNIVKLFSTQRLFGIFLSPLVFFSSIWPLILPVLYNVREWNKLFNVFVCIQEKMKKKTTSFGKASCSISFRSVNFKYF